MSENIPTNKLSSEVESGIEARVRGFKDMAEQAGETPINPHEIAASARKEIRIKGKLEGKKYEPGIEGGMPPESKEVVTNESSPAIAQEQFKGERVNEIAERILKETTNKSPWKHEERESDDMRLANGDSVKEVVSAALERQIERDGEHRTMVKKTITITGAVGVLGGGLGAIGVGLAEGVGASSTTLLSAASMAIPAFVCTVAYLVVPYAMKKYQEIQQNRHELEYLKMLGVKNPGTQ